MRNKEGQETEITPEDFTRFRKHVGKFISSSPSGIHYSHCKASTKFKLSSEVHAQQRTIIARSGMYPGRWNVGFQVVLEKIADVCLVKKVRYIQIYEADSNFFQQFIFGREAMNLLTDKGVST